MKAGVVHAREDVRFEEIEKPVPKKGQVLIKVKYTGTCGSDVPRVNGDACHFFPNVLGHELSGTMEAVGEGVTKIRPGSRVAGVPVKKTLILIYMKAAAMYGLAGFMLGAKAGGASVQTGYGYEMEAIAACTIGGVSVTGGRGKVSSAIIGVAVFELLKVTLQYLGMNANAQYIAIGVVIFVAISLDIRKYIARK